MSSNIRPRHQEIIETWDDKVLQYHNTKTDVILHFLRLIKESEIQAPKFEDKITSVGLSKLITNSDRYDGEISERTVNKVLKRHHEKKDFVERKDLTRRMKHENGVVNESRYIYEYLKPDECEAKSLREKMLDAGVEKI